MPKSEDSPLGRGFHASAEFKQLTARAHNGFLTIIGARKLLIPGPTYFKRDDGAKITHPARRFVAKMLLVSEDFVRNCVSEDNVHGTDIPAPQKRGRTPKDHKKVYPDLFELIEARIRSAQTTGEVITLRKLLEHLSEKDCPDMGYEMLRYHMLKLGFNWGRIVQNLKSARTKPYVLGWLQQHAARRVHFAENPDPSVVHAYLDETFLHRDATGSFSWFYGKDNRWAKSIFCPFSESLATNKRPR